MQQLIIAAIAAVVGIFYVFQTGRVFVSPLSDPSGPKAFPYFIAVLLFVGCGVLVSEGLAVRKAAKSAPVAADDAARIKFWPLVPVVVLTAMYFAAFEPVGYMISTAIYLLVLMWIFNPGKHVANLTTSIAFTVASYFMLAKLLEAQLPAGDLLGRFAL